MPVVENWIIKRINIIIRMCQTVLPIRNKFIVTCTFVAYKKQNAYFCKRKGIQL